MKFEFQCTIDRVNNRIVLKGASDQMRAIIHIKNSINAQHALAPKFRLPALLKEIKDNPKIITINNDVSLVIQGASRKGLWSILEIFISDYSIPRDKTQLPNSTMTFVIKAILDPDKAHSEDQTINQRVVKNNT